MSPLYHGITVRDAALMCGVAEGTVRSWLSRGQLTRTRDGQICPLSLRDWWDARDMDMVGLQAGHAVTGHLATA